MRRFVSALVIGLIIACPLLCQAAQADGCAESEQTTNAPSESPERPLPCPDDGVSCICAGAVHSTVRSADHSPDLLPSIDGWLFATFLQPVPLALLHLAGDGAEPDRAPWRASQRVHALIQHYRC